MRVLFLSAANSIHTQRWVNALVNRDLEVVLVSLPNHKAGLNDIDKKVKIIYLPYKGVKGYYLNSFKLKKIIIEEKINLINAHYASGYGTLARLAKFHPTILSVWGSDVYDFPYQNKTNFRIAKKNLEFADYVASTSHCMASVTRKITNKNLDITITPFGVNIESFFPQHNLVKDRFIFGTVKALSNKYGIDFLIKCYKRFCEILDENQTPNNTCYEIYGSGSQQEEYMLLIKNLNIGDRIFIKGFVDNKLVPSVLNSFDVFLLGSRLDSESFGVAAVEAMSCELPIISTDASGLNEVIDNEVTGFVVKKEDIEAFSQRMVELYMNETLRNKMGVLGRKKVVRFYNWDENVDTMLELYTNVVNNDKEVRY